MKPFLKTTRDKSACANVFLELPLTTSGIIFEWMQHHAMDHTLTYTLYIDYLWHSHRNKIQKHPPKVFLKNLQISQENTCVGVSFLESCKPPGLQRY